MLHLLNELWLPITIFYVTPLVFGLWFINKKITDLGLKDRTIWMMLLVFMPIIAVIVFYSTQLNNKKIKA
jgi:hypothetical protein